MYKQVILRWKLRILGYIPFARPVVRLFSNRKESSSPVILFNGLRFNNRIGLGPGLDKDGQHYNILYDFGFSFINLGPVSSSNVKTVISHLQAESADPVISLSISQNHVRTFSLAYDFADMFCFEIPDDDIIDTLNSILDIRLTYDQSKPVLLRLSHELPRHDLENILGYCQLNGVDGLVVADTASVRLVRSIVQDRLAIIGYGGIKTPEKAREFIDAGADLIEITDGLMQEGASIVGKIQKHIVNI